MVALPSSPNDPTRRVDPEQLYRSAPRLWRAALRVDRLVVAATGRLEVSGDVTDAVRGGPVLLAANHIGNVDALVLMAACARQRIPVRFLATGGLFDTPVLGHLLRATGHVRADRGTRTVAEALDRVVHALADDPRPVLVYPEGRISREPGLWPERGKTGISRMALASGAAVIPVSQWGAHEAIDYGAVRPGSARDILALAGSWVRALRRRPRLRVHFGAPVDLSGLSAERTGDAARARDRIMRAITAGLVELRPDEPDTPAHVDPTRPTTGKRSPWRP
ncbi:1-acyl-sn-glycerol-3-phosphate acyltransferase [Saccharopolyspora sp. HNM0983]|uniref:1-acyl-sn-glycerol-3-phosphate acyltransferase n=1 Tax=Saccharopolyspora montiporae TaxID=2781240 RepID=A0A929FZE4_9PSEU|nr:lysophospholipid acyltransferase family protein [Saccharopolyspora sp. HNM0983]MBE9374289.1 1-acyl-sn-glycerol-3-phosphate acyltransferase [Saccharopolyspora sp. HNM0983]